MGHFITIGRHHINLDHVTEVQEYTDGSVRLYWDYPVEGDYRASITAHNDFHGDDAKRLLLMVRYYDASPLPDDYNIQEARRQDAPGDPEGGRGPGADSHICTAVSIPRRPPDHLVCHRLLEASKGGLHDHMPTWGGHPIQPSESNV